MLKKADFDKLQGQIPSSGIGREEGVHEEWEFLKAERYRRGAITKVR